MIQNAGSFSWSVLRIMKMTHKLAQQRVISSASKIMIHMYGGHIPVLVEEIMEILDPKDDKVIHGTSNQSKIIKFNRTK